MVKVRGVRRLTALLVTGLAPKAGAITTDDVPTLTQGVQYFKGPRVPLIWRVGAANLVRSDKVFTHVLTIVTPDASVNVPVRLNGPIRRILRPFLYPRSVRVIGTSRSFRRLFTIQPNVRTVLLHIRARIRDHRIRFTLPADNQVKFFRNP